MRENVVEELQQLKPNDETKLKMVDILKTVSFRRDMDSTDEPVDTTDEDGK